MSGRALVVIVTTITLAGVAHAEKSTTLSALPAGTMIGDRLVMVVTPPEQFNSSAPAEVSNVLYLNRCSGGCMVTGGTINDARQHISTYITPGPHIVGEYQNNAAQTGAAADAEWNQVVQCVKEIYSPFNIIVQDTLPTGTGNYTEAIVGGTSQDVGLNQSIGGVAPAHTSCDPNDNAMSYTFANNGYYFGDTQYRVWQICGVVGQESAHHFGLDHSYEFFDETSACNDPMTYRSDCGGQKFFRNKAAKCGEGEVRECYCGGLQNTHAKILNVFGPGTSLIPPPTVGINLPMNGQTITNTQVVGFSAGSKRGVEKSELYLNGYKWAEVKGAAFGGSGQLNPSNYTVMLPAGVPDGVIDIEIVAYDDLGLSNTSAAVTVTKGAPCSSAASCATGQKCDAGKCYWDPPTGQLGEACGYNQFCETNSCIKLSPDDAEGYCSQSCVVASADACPMGFECIPAGAMGACLPEDTNTGCCSVGGGSVWGHAGMVLFVGLLLGRRRRRLRTR